jgi:acetyl esterase/lipase
VNVCTFSNRRDIRRPTVGPASSRSTVAVDPTTPFAGARAFQQAINKSGNRCELVVQEGGNHGYFMRDRAQYDDTLKEIDVFLASLGWLSDK